MDALNGARCLAVLYSRMVELIMQCEILHIISLIRKNSLLAASDAGGQNLVILYFAATTKVNSVNYRQWFEDVFIRINTAPVSQIDSLCRKDSRPE